MPRTAGTEGVVAAERDNTSAPICVGVGDDAKTAASDGVRAFAEPDAVGSEGTIRFEMPESASGRESMTRLLARGNKGNPRLFGRLSTCSPGIK